MVQFARDGRLALFRATAYKWMVRMDIRTSVWWTASAIGFQRPAKPTAMAIIRSVSGPALSRTFTRIAKHNQPSGETLYNGKWESTQQ